MTPVEVYQHLDKFRHLLRINNMFIDGFRFIMWWIIYGLGNVLSGMAKIFFGMYDLLDIWNNEKLQQFIAPYIPVFWALAVVAVIWAGFKIISNKKVDYSEKMNNFILAVTLFFGVSFIMNQGISLIKASTATFQSTENPVVQIYQGNITDLMTVDKNKWKSNKEPQNAIKKMKDVENIGSDGITDVMDVGGLFSNAKVSDNGKDILKKRIAVSNGGIVLKNMTGIFVKDKYYYQFVWHPWFMLIEIVAMVAVYFLSSIKVVVLIAEFHLIGMLTKGIALTGIDKSDRNIKLLTKLRDTAAVLVIQALLMSIYSIFMGLSATVIPSQIGKLITIIGLSMFAVMGPNIIGEIFGIRPELGSVGGTLMGVGFGASMASRGAATAGKTMKSAAKSVASKTLNSGATVAGAISGFGKKPTMPSIGSRVQEEIGKGNQPDLAQDIAQKSGMLGSNGENQSASNVGNTGSGASNGNTASQAVGGQSGNSANQRTVGQGGSNTGNENLGNFGQVGSTDALTTDSQNEFDNFGATPGIGNIPSEHPETIAAATSYIADHNPTPLTTFSSPNINTGMPTMRSVPSSSLYQSGLSTVGQSRASGPTFAGTGTGTVMPGVSTGATIPSGRVGSAITTPTPGIGSRAAVSVPGQGSIPGAAVGTPGQSTTLGAIPSAQGVNGPSIGASVTPTSIASSVPSSDQGALAAIDSGMISGGAGGAEGYSIGAVGGSSAMIDNPVQMQLPVNTSTIPLLARQSNKILQSDIHGTQESIEQKIATAPNGTMIQSALQNYSNRVGQFQQTPTVQSAKRKFSIAQRTTSDFKRGK